MEDNKLRALERQYKLRVKTGCGTCRIRRVKCDEAKPECQRCTKTGRKCDGYAPLARKSPPSAAASYRNSSFLSIPSAAWQISRSPSAELSDDSNENRSFSYFRTRTLPQWTEFFDSELWSQQILQLSYHEPAIRHGLLALSTLHERFERTSHVVSPLQSDYAFVQYMQAVKHSNKLLADHQHGKVPVEKVLLACIIFVCYENLAGNYASAAMHLQNGLRILAQYQSELSRNTAMSTQQDSIANVLFRFDFQAMTFTDMTSPYKYEKSYLPSCPTIPAIYTSTAAARNDLVALLRFMMWVYNVSDSSTDPTSDPVLVTASTQLIASFQAWVITFEAYTASLPANTLQNPKAYAGITLLRVYSIMCQTIAQGSTKGEMFWDAHIESLRTILELSETLPSLSTSAAPPAQSPTPSNTSSSSSSPTTTTTSNPSHSRPLAPTTPPARSPPYSLPIRPSPRPIAPRSSSLPTRSPPPRSFSPSFELSPIVPLFLVATRCRDPLIRRRAIAVLGGSRRREGVWDSIGAAAVAAEAVRIEEGLDEGESWAGYPPPPHPAAPAAAAASSDVASRALAGEPEEVDLLRRLELPMGRVRCMADVAEEMRVGDVMPRVSLAERVVRVRYVMPLRTVERIVRF